MGELKTKSIKNIEEKMEDMDMNTIRYNVLQHARDFKTSWIKLGQVLYTVWKDRLYKDWGYNKFETFASQEIGVRKQTAIKLLRSYAFLEKEEPRYISDEYNKENEVSSVPSFESVDVLRMANSKKDIDRSDYERMKRNVLEKGRDVRDVKKDLTAMIKQREELQPEEARAKRKLAILKRFVSILRSVKEEMRISKMLPAKTLKEIDSLINRLESEVS